MSAGATPEARERRVTPFRWVLCMSEVMARDEDLFSTIKAIKVRRKAARLPGSTPCLAPLLGTVHRPLPAPGAGAFLHGS